MGETQVQTEPSTRPLLPPGDPHTPGPRVATAHLSSRPPPCSHSAPNPKFPGYSLLSETGKTKEIKAAQQVRKRGPPGLCPEHASASPRSGRPQPHRGRKTTLSSGTRHRPWGLGSQGRSTVRLMCLWLIKRTLYNYTCNLLEARFVQNLKL